MKKIIALIAFLSGGCLAAGSAAAERVVECDASKAAAVEVETDPGGITFEPSDDGKVTAVITGDFDEDNCKLGAKAAGGKLVLTLKGKRRWFWSGSSCKAGFAIKAPASTKIAVKTGSGGVEIGAFNAGAEVVSGAGSVKFGGLTGPVRVMSGAGSVSGRVYSESFEARIGAGSLDLDWTKSPMKGAASVKSGAGAVRIGFPSGSRVRVNCSSGAGSVTNALGSDPSAAFRLDVKSGAGSVDVRKS